MPKFQSAYRRHQSTETALLRVMSDVIGSMNNQRVTLLSLLNLSAVFECVHHEILLSRLEKTFGIRDTALEWITLILSGRTQQVCYNSQLSDIGRLLYGVPQRSVLGSLFYILYTSDLMDIISELGFTLHSYADDMQIYTGILADETVRASQQLAV
jgi:Reverse transcriptase (RNA-dependent DNA polymerase)